MINTKYIVIIILLILLIGITTEAKKEHASSLTNDEALQAISSLYNNKNMTVTNLTITNNLNPANFKGVIVAYGGDVTNLPVGWVLCDGTNGTPDLRGRFIYGYNPADTEIKDASGLLLRSKLKLRDVSGEEYHTLSINEMPSHTHSYWYRWWGGGDSNRSNTPAGDEWGKNDKKSDAFYTGGNKPHNNMPPYIVLAYIMKT